MVILCPVPGAVAVTTGHSQYCQAGKKVMQSTLHCNGPPATSHHCIFDRFLAIASSTAFSCIRSSSRRDEVLFRFEAPAAVSDGCISAGFDSGWSGRGRDDLDDDRVIAVVVAAVK